MSHTHATPRLAPAQALLAGLLCVASVRPAAATVVEVPPLDQLTARSGVVVHGVVRAHDTVELNGHTFTRSVLEVAEGIKGAGAGERLQIFQLGVRSGPHTAWVAGAKLFEVTDEVVFFGSRWPKGGPSAVIPYGVGFGVFDVPRDGAGAHVLEDVGEVAELRGGKPARPVARAAPALAAFLETVRAYARVDRVAPGARVGEKQTPHAR